MSIRRTCEEIAGLACLGLAALGAGACGDNWSGNEEPGSGGAACAGDNGGLELPPGFCATVFADKLGRARHLTVTSAGDVLVAIAPESAADPGRVVALRDADSDGVAEVVMNVIDFGGNGIAWQANRLFVATADRIVRFELAAGALEPRTPQVVVEGLPASGDHTAKTVVVAGDVIYVNRGSASNACQVENRVLHSPGIEPCPELAVRAGVWRFSANELEQPGDIGVRVATGVRNASALALAPGGGLWAVINGRDHLHENWPERFTPAQELALPGEEIAAIQEGVDRGWPYCYYDPQRNDMMLAPEYGGDGVMTGRCDAIPNPSASLPAHWAPLGAVFYDARQFPARYRGGMFVANHGSRFDSNASTRIPGYNVVFVPFPEGLPGDWEDFATGFTRGGQPLPDAAAHRPVGVAVTPDGALLISDDWGGRIWKVGYRR